MFRILKRKRVAVPLGVVMSLAVAAAAFAYFTSTGSETNTVSVGSASPWTVTPSAARGGPLYPGSGTENIPYTITNTSPGHQQLSGTSAVVASYSGSVKADAGYVTQGGNAQVGCLASWFAAVNTAPTGLPQDLAGGGSVKGSVAVTMQDSGSNQDACAGVSPDVTIGADVTPPLLGDWDFASGSETDLTGNWSKFTPEGTVSISSSGLAVSGNGSAGDQPSSSAWAEASGYSGPPIGAKTFVSWLKLDSTSGVGGGGLALEQYLGGAAGNDGQFDALDYAETQGFQWVPGSDNFNRTQNFSPGDSDTATGVTTQVAISYSAGIGTETITGCLNGQSLGSYSTANAATFSSANAPLALFGPRSYDNALHEAGGGIDAHILESRIYGGAMSCAQIVALSP
jgi:hypothetical protein